MGDFGADTLRDSIEAGWALTGQLTKTSIPTMKEVVQFYAHPQIVGNEWSKAVEVQKINTAGNENVITHPKFEEIHDRFEITCRYRLKGSNETQYDEAEQDIEDMCEEVVRIVKTVYNPSSGTGIFSKTDRQWVNRDNFEDASKPELKRLLVFTLTHLQSDDSTVFHGFSNGILALDTSATTADSKPASDYTFTEVHTVEIDFGYDVIAEYVRGGTATQGVADYFQGGFSGTFSCVTYTKKADITSSTIEALDNIYKLQNNNELAEIVFLHSVDNTEGTPVTFTESIPLLITRIRKTFEDTAIVEFTIEAIVSATTAYTVA